MLVCTCSDKGVYAGYSLPVLTYLTLFCTLYQAYEGEWTEENEIRGIRQAWVFQKCTQNCQLENPKGSGHLGKLGIDGRILKCALIKEGVAMWTTFIWQSKATKGGVLWTQSSSLPW